MGFMDTKKRPPAHTDHELRHDIVKVAADPLGDSRVDPQTTLTIL